MKQDSTPSVPDKKRRRLMILAAVAVVVLGLVLGVRSWIRMPEIPQDGPEAEVPGWSHPGQTTLGRKEGTYTFLVAGKDVYSGSTDTMLLLSYDTKAKTIFGLNLPRDTMMNVSTPSKRLNAIYNYNKGDDKQTQAANGMTALKGAVADLTGITPDFYVLVEWEAIGELVDALGGVEFEVPFDMDYDDPYQDPPLHIHQQAGLRTLKGDDAMQVIRWRKNNNGGGSGGDLARLTIQQDFLKAVVKTCLKPATVLKFPSLVEIFKQNVETDLTVGNILAFAEQAIGMDPATGVTFATAPVADSFKYNKAALITLDAQGLLDIVNANMNPWDQDITLDDVEVLVRGSDGNFSITSGELAEGINNYTRPAPKPEPPAESEPPAEGEVPAEGETEPEPQEPVEGEDPVEGETPMEGEQPGEGEEPSGTETPTEPDVLGEELPGQPEPILPAPEQPIETPAEPEIPQDTAA